MDRRDFLRVSMTGLAGLGLTGVGPIALRAGEKSGKNGYNIIILGDTHYDSADPEMYHAGYSIANKTREEAHRKEFIRNGKMWKKRSPLILKRAACLVDDDTRFVLQMGDLIQGDTADADIHRKFLDDAFSVIKAGVAPELPFVTVVGNHDVRANVNAVAAKAYADYMPARMAQELNLPIESNNFLFREGPDAFVVFDFNAPDIPSLERMLSEAEGARHTFVVLHCPVFPYENPKYFWWILLGNRKDSRSEERRYVRSLLASHNVIALCGHTHQTEFVDWYGDGGRITQMTMSSVWNYAARGSYNQLASGQKGYGSALAQKDPEVAAGKASALFDEYRPGIRNYITADSAGSYKLIVDGKRVYVDFYAGDSARRSKRFTLR